MTARLPLLALLMLLMVATGLRTYRLGDVPAGFFCDEAAEGWAVIAEVEVR